MMNYLTDNIADNLEWAEIVGMYRLDRIKDGQEYYDELLNLIRSVCDGSFDICVNAKCRLSRHSVAILQKKPLPWSYLFSCMRLAKKDFVIILPDSVRIKTVGGRRLSVANVYAWYDKHVDAIECFAYTGNTVIEEDTSPGYDGFGRFDVSREVVRGSIRQDGKWLVKPYLQMASLYSL